MERLYIRVDKWLITQYAISGSVAKSDIKLIHIKLIHIKLIHIKLIHKLVYEETFQITAKSFSLTRVLISNQQIFDC